MGVGFYVIAFTHFVIAWFWGMDMGMEYQIRCCAFVLGCTV